jgi:hypothetical protein
LLKRHSELRKTKGWGKGLEKTFYSNLDFDRALEVGIKAGHISSEEAEIEKEVLLHFAPRIDKLMEDEMKVVTAFQQKLVEEKENFLGFSMQISRFCGSVQLTVPAYLFANPDDREYGGGYNGGILTLEIPRQYDASHTFLHELMHAFVDTQCEHIQKAFEDAKDLDFQTLNEGIAYALSPGIFHSEGPDSDPLRMQVERDLQNNKTMKDPYFRFKRYGLALRPLLNDALQDETQTLQTFLSRAIDAWRVLKSSI